MWRGKIGNGQIQPWAEDVYRDVFGGRPPDEYRELDKHEAKQKGEDMFAYAGEIMRFDEIRRGYNSGKWTCEAFWRAALPPAEIKHAAHSGPPGSFEG